MAREAENTQPAVLDHGLTPARSSELARECWQRYQYGELRGHLDYCAEARRLEGFYLGGGAQWTEAERRDMEAEGRPCLEFNEVMPAINAAIGYQIHNRVDISYRPRGGEADADLAATMSKVVMHVADQNRLHWAETQVLADGLIQQRGYLELRVEFERSVTGEIVAVPLDPLDVIPDPDAKSYDTDEWQDVIVCRWLTLDEIERLYGEPARLRVENDVYERAADFGDGDNSQPRNKFGGYWRGTWTGGGDGNSVVRVRVLDWQRHITELSHVEVSPEGDITLLPDAAAVARAQATGRMVQRRMVRRVRWTVCSPNHTLHDDWSPYRHFSIVPYFPFFRRGVTRGLADNAVDPQRVLNKAISQYVHILNTTANSGWAVEQNSLTNMTTDDLETEGARSGLVMEYREGRPMPTKIQPNPIPSGVDQLIERAQLAVRETTVPEAMRGIQSQEITGVAIQSRQFAAQQQLAVPLDNLAKTRHLVAQRLVELVQQFYTDERVFRITEVDLAGREQQVPVAVNQYDPASGTFLNDLTLGEYDVVISEQPMQVTFENTQFTQALELREKGIAIPDAVVIRHSNLTDKHEILEQIQNAAAPPDPLTEAKTQLALAQVEKTKAETVHKGVEAEYSAIQTAATIAAMPQTADTADALLQAAGFVDRNGPPLVNAPVAPVPAPALAGLPTNTHPITPANPGVGLHAGIETAAAPA